MVEVRGLFVAEGTSDARLSGHLEVLTMEAGAAEAVVRCPDLSRLPTPPGRNVLDQARAALRVHADTNLLFVHRDADGRDPRPRYEKIQSAPRGVNLPRVCVVPVQALEAWLLVDGDAILRARGRSPGTAVAELPQDPERIARPKERLQHLVDRVQEGRPRRRRTTLIQARSRLLDSLDPFSLSLRTLPSWRRLVADIQSAVDSLR